MELTEEDRKLQDAFERKLERDLLAGRKTRDDLKSIKDEARALIANGNGNFRQYMQAIIDGEGDQ